MQMANVKETVVIPLSRLGWLLMKPGSHGTNRGLGLGDLGRELGKEFHLSRDEFEA